MGKRKDRALIFEAADSWHDEYLNYIIPGALPEERKGRKKYARKLHKALIREQSRLEARRLTGRQ